MLDYDTALHRILTAVPGALPAESVARTDALGRALSHDLVAEVDLPPFDNSAVDGYAVRLTTTRTASPHCPLALPVTLEIPAGSWPERPLRAGEAARIFTGAPLPEGADALVMVEDTEEDPERNGWIVLRDSGSAHFIRRMGSDLRKGALALPVGTTIRPGEIGILASLNHDTLMCPRSPRVGLLTTGDEVVRQGALAPGQIRDSNGPSIEAAVRQVGATLWRREHAGDTPDAVAAAFDALAGCDLILSTGGVSVGDHDHVKAVVEKKGTLDFWRIAIKPGKPLAFGRMGDALFLGLPGNPVSSLVTFELFVRPLLRKMAGHAQTQRPNVSVVLESALPHVSGRREFVRARIRWAEGHCLATPTGAQSSHRLHSMVGVDALLIAREEHGDYGSGEALQALLLG